MGCINSKKDLADINTNIFRVSIVDTDGTALWNGQLEISRTELTLYRKGKKPAQWPLQSLRRYGYDADLFSFEAGRRCDTGPGIYAFRCRRAESLFHTLQTYIQGRAYSTDENINPNDLTFPIPTSSNGPSIISRNSQQHLLQQQQQNQHNSMSRPNSTGIQFGQNITTTNSGGGGGGIGIGIGDGGVMYINRQSGGGGGVTTSQSLSPNGTIHSNSNQSRSSDTLTSAIDTNNYLEPTPLNRHHFQLHNSNNNNNLNQRFSLGGSGSGGGTGIRLSSVSSGGPLSPDLQSPGSPNSITNILEVTPLNPLPHNSSHHHHGVSNLYQEFPPLRSEFNNNNNNINTNNNNNSNNNNNNSSNINNNSNNLNNSKKLSLDIPPQEPAPGRQQQQQTIKVDKSCNTGSDSPIRSGGGVPLRHPISPIQHQDSTHSYMNVNLGEQTPLLVNSSSCSSTTATLLSNYNDSPNTSTPPIQQTIFGFNNRLIQSQIIDTNRCYENLEPGDIRPMLLRTNRYSKPDIFSKVDLPGLGLDKSEPCTPTNSDRKVNYIVLDLDQNQMSLTAVSGGGGGGAGGGMGGCNSGASNSSTYLNNSQDLIGGSGGGGGTGLTINNNNNNSISNSLTLSNLQSTINCGVNTTNQLLPPESPKNSSMGYATIDFNKTVALSNSTLPSQELDSEGSRKTRHNSTAAPMTITSRHSNSISE